MKNAPLVSVLMPAYNAEKTIARALDSLKAQTYPNFEAIIVLDGCSDKTREICETYGGDGRFKMLEKPVNEGVANALNAGLARCFGEFIARLDADDCAAPARLWAQAEYMLDNPEVNLCATDYFIIEGEKRTPARCSDDIKRGLIFRNTIAHPTVMFRRGLFDKYPLKAAEDYACWAEVYDKLNVGVIHEPLTDYYVRGGNISIVNGAEMRICRDETAKALRVSLGSDNIFLTDDLPPLKNGVIQAVLDRANALGGFIVACFDDFDLQNVAANYRRRGDIGENVEILSAFDVIRGGTSSAVRAVNEADKRGTIYYDCDGKPIVARFWSPDNKDFHPLDVHYDKDGEICLKVEYVYDNSRFFDVYHAERGLRNYPYKYTAVERGGERVMNSRSEFVAYCVEKMGATGIVTEEGLGFGGVARFTRESRAKNVLVVHSAFSLDPNDENSPLQPYYAHLPDEADNYDKIVFLTDEEMSDYIKRFGDNGRLAVIGNCYSGAAKRAPFKERDARKLIFCGRLERKKGVFDALEIFAAVVKKLPNATLDIYGRGNPEAEKAVMAKIIDLGLFGKARLTGFSFNMGAVFSKAAALIMTSRVEGRPLSLAEAMSNGCAVFSYDIKYGVKEAALIPYGDKKEYAKRLVEFLSDKVFMRVMSDICYSTAKIFDKARFTQMWRELCKN